MVLWAVSSVPCAAVITTIWTSMVIVMSDMAQGISIRGEPAVVSSDNVETYTRDLIMPGVTTKNHDAYICAAFPLNSTLEEWVIKYEPLTSADRVHHMLIFGCTGVDQKLSSQGFWDCGHHGVCQGGSIMYAWAKNAPSLSLPDDVGFRIAGQSGIKYITVQIHYANPVLEEDRSGLRMSLTTKKQKYKAGIYLLASGYVDIPPHTEKTHADMNCRLRDTAPYDINLFAFRTHAHKLGSVISGYKFDEKTNEYTEIAKGNPQWPQAFYPMKEVQHIKMDDILTARCTWNSSSMDKHTYIGSTGDDEMCNLYLMYYTDVDHGSESGGCGYVQFQSVLDNLPADSDVNLPPNPLLEEHAKGHNNHDEKEKVYQTITNSKTIKKPEPVVAANRGETYTRDLLMPGIAPKTHDAYMCAAFPLNSTIEEWVVRFDPMSSADRVHHMLLYGCTGVDQNLASQGAWDCGHHGVCQGGSIVYAWAKNAPATNLPDDVGFRIAGQTNIKYLTLQIHYADPIEEGQEDHSGLRMSLTTKTQKYKAGIYLLMSVGADIPPHTEKTHADMNCRLRDTAPAEINLFAYRTHAHKLGSVISGYKFNEKTNEYTEIAKGNPQWPQAFYPMKEVQHIKMDDILTARCTWNSSNMDTHTYIGSTGDDEMCNLYLMYYTDVNKGSESGGCAQVQFQEVLDNLPTDSDVPLPPNPLLEEHAKGHNNHQETEKQQLSLTKNEKEKEKVYQTVANGNSIEVEKKGHTTHKKPVPGVPQPVPVTYDDYSTENESYPPPAPPALPSRGHNTIQQDISASTTLTTHRKDKQLRQSAYSLVNNWGPKDYDFGQVVAVATDSQGDVIVFHRGERHWDGATFVGNSLRDTSNPIQKSTLLHLNKENGQIIDKWGEKFFYMPHGLTVDQNDNIWVTDVGMHQVFKFAKGYANSQPLIILGTRFKPGNDDSHFCKPTAVAVLTSGEFFVSDGYCNSRVIKYSADGKKILMQIGKASGGFLGLSISTPAPSTFRIPHGLTLAEDQGEVCVADRENGRVQCFTISTGKFTRQFQFDGWGGRLFAVSYTPAMGGKLFAVNGPEFVGQKVVQAFEVDFTTGKLVGSFSPNNQGLSNPHDIIVSHDGVDVYIVEIGPNKLWKFELDSVLKAANKNPPVTSTPPKVEAKAEKLSEGDSDNKYGDPYKAHWTSLSVSTIVLSMVAVPIVVLTSLTLIIRARRTGERRFKMRNMSNGVLKSNGRNGKHDNGLNLGSLLNKHHGFEKLATEDLDHDTLDSGDSDIEEFSQVATRA